MLLIKKLKNTIQMPLTILMNKSLENGQVPTCMKTAKVTPIYKSKNVQLCTNYRPISLLPSISKILEKLVHNFINTQKMFFESQYGFRHGHSTINAITELATNILQSFDYVIGTLCVIC